MLFYHCDYYSKQSYYFGCYMVRNTTLFRMGLACLTNLPLAQSSIHFNYPPKMIIRLSEDTVNSSTNSKNRDKEEWDKVYKSYFCKCLYLYL